jgi:hypothetical protein
MVQVVIQVVKIASFLHFLHLKSKTVVNAQCYPQYLDIHCTRIIKLLIYYENVFAPTKKRYPLGLKILTYLITVPVSMFYRTSLNTVHVIFPPTMFKKKN